MTYVDLDLERTSLFAFISVVFYSIHDHVNSGLVDPTRTRHRIADQAREGGRIVPRRSVRVLSATHAAPEPTRARCSVAGLGSVLAGPHSR